ncbi:MULTISPECIES: hypothetical protein [Chryseobacterium]|uniref:Uncharacterized protein n=1 Tax=Chryseobacterium camelliae TaxID=1265445 RepID=A0ABU0TIX3_9FLAO|nr:MULTISPECIES: hypothetical protein [Chryseobacterium]MDT3406077.1 hypothetical protein [Pseudacidovorax intermedius]MDQ1096123.1 hypothetical protein [Chryseobacterium camelliae]MDQ1100059.1 hypothetical protein [Chryseobacterium sp. SORGH_AS_1048]MDR6087402.1 hypothetical protein [Chryseobacterium sp. SORGH_AS_0909]MDR6131777.1 hypothetical protein [Chryseobacterium sp. SORGH_AS_1175]
MKTLLLILSLGSVMTFAQKNPGQKKNNDSIWLFSPKDTAQSKKETRSMGGMPVAKPDTSVYSGLNAPVKNEKQYRILNGMEPKKQAKPILKAAPKKPK